MNFKKDNYLIIKNILSQETTEVAENYLFLKRKVFLFLNKKKIISPFDQTWGFLGDTQVTNTYVTYGDVLMDVILAKVQKNIEDKIKIKLSPTYSYARVYKKGDDLKRHKDRYSCEISATLNLGGDQWPIYVEPNPKKGGYTDAGYIPDNTKGKKIILNPGDALIYKGCELEHWRDKFNGEMCLQVFLHYNSVDYKNIYDGREHLGIPKY
jgi:hypothetical protein